MVDEHQSAQNKMPTTISHNERDTISLGKRFGLQLKPGDVVAVYGELGTGKTRFIKGICEGLGVHEHVASPTFTIVNEYRFPGGTVYHFDFYRVNSTQEIRDVGFEEYANSDGVCLIEWADRAKELLPGRRYDVLLTLGDNENERAITIGEPTEVVL